MAEKLKIIPLGGLPSLPLARIHKLKIGYILRTNTRNI